MIFAELAKKKKLQCKGFYFSLFLNSSLQLSFFFIIIKSEDYLMLFFNVI